MLELTVDPKFVNNLGIEINPKNLTDFCQVLIDLHVGTSVWLKDFILPIDKTLIGDTTGYYTTPVIFEDDNIVELYEYLLIEVPAIPTAPISEELNPQETMFQILSDYLSNFIPKVYEKSLSYALHPKTISSCFVNKTLILFQFKNQLLESISTLPWEKNLEAYLNEITLSADVLNKGQKRALENMFEYKSFNKMIYTTYFRGYSYPYYKNSHEQSKVSCFIMKNYIRINKAEFSNGKVCLLMSRDCNNGSYTSNIVSSNLISAIINPDSITSTIPKSYLGSIILNMSNRFYISLSKQIYPIIIDTPIEENNIIRLYLSQDDKEFLEAIKELEPASIYTKHRRLICNPGDKEVRGCAAIYNASKTIKVVIREEKKKLSDEEAYRNRIFRDYLSYAVSLVCIPIFQKEFVIPSCLDKSFDFRMATIKGLWYKPSSYHTNPKYTDKYDTVFATDNLKRDPNWIKPIIPTDIPVKGKEVKDFVNGYKEKTLKGSTQSRPSIFTRHFVEPFLEIINSSYGIPNTACIFGWMYDIDGQYQRSYNYKLNSAHLLRRSACFYEFYNCGLMTDKTFGIKSIMNHVFTLPEFSHPTLLQQAYSISNPTEYLPEEKKNQFVSAVLDIYTANFVPCDNVEEGIKAFMGPGMNNELARVNQLLFLTEDSLNILQTLYKCENFEQLSDCLSLCIPICLDIVNNLNYSQELKDHITALFNYFWKTTMAISEELSPHET